MVQCIEDRGRGSVRRGHGSVHRGWTEVVVQ